MSMKHLHLVDFKFHQRKRCSIFGLCPVAVREHQHTFPDNDLLYLHIDLITFVGSGLGNLLV